MLSMNDLEDITIARNLREAAEINAETREMKSLIDYNNQLLIAVRTKDQQLAKLRQELTATVNSCNARHEMDRASKLVAKHFRLEYSKATGQAEAETQEFAARLWRKAFDKFVDDGLQHGKFSEDPRKTGDLADWYASLP